MPSDLSIKHLLLSCDNLLRAEWCFITQATDFVVRSSSGPWGPGKKQMQVFKTSKCLFPNEQAKLVKRFQLSLKRPFGPSKSWLDFVEQGFTEFLLWNGSKGKYRFLLVTPKLLIEGCTWSILHLTFFINFIFLSFWDLQLLLLTLCVSLPFVFNTTRCPLRGQKLQGPWVGIFVHQSQIRMYFSQFEFCICIFLATE